MTPKEIALNLYNQWYDNNRSALELGKWSLVDRNLLTCPEQDKLRGLNLIAYLPREVSEDIDSKLLPKLTDIIGDSTWIVPSQGRHLTILDLIPHNSGVEIGTIKSTVNGYEKAIEEVIKEFDETILIGLEGIFASPDGITIQGFPLNSSIFNLRDRLRKRLRSLNLTNLESSKYKIETAHITLAKFVNSLDGQKLVNVIDNLRNIELGKFPVEELVLNISPRYDKVKTVEVIRKYQLR